MHTKSRYSRPVPVLVALCALVGLSLPMLVTNSAASADAQVQVVKSGPEPTVQAGPAVLHWNPADAPQLQNSGIWRASPILISGTSAYRDGEFLYQDFLYDDQGTGSYTYPTNPDYANNAADLVEVRVQLTPEGTAFRITTNSMHDPNLVATTIALGGEAGVSYPIPHRANAVEPARVFVTVHGTSADIVDAATGLTLPQSPQVSVDTTSHQVEVLVPFSAFDPRGNTSLRVAAATGLWDQQNNRYLIPNNDLTNGGMATTTQPGGGGTSANPPAFFNVAFRFNETASMSYNLGNRAPDAQQSAALSAGDLSPFYATVDFDRLAHNVTDNMTDQPGGIPTSGFMDRILASHFEEQQGQTGQSGGNIYGGYACNPPACIYQYSGNLVPYEIYVPHKPPPPSGYGLVVDLHPAGETYNYDINSPVQPILGERGSGSIVLTPEARGDTYFYYGEAGAEVFEDWAGVARLYQIDPSNVVLTGISMGGCGTFKLGTQWPDLFRALVPDVGCASTSEGWSYISGTPDPGGANSENVQMLPSLRNIPVFADWGQVDPVINPEWATIIRQTLDDLGYRYDAHFYDRTHDEYRNLQPQALVDYLDATAPTNPNPAHVTYVFNNFQSQPDVGLTADHAYWLSGLSLRDSTLSPPIGKMDVFSHGFGVNDPNAQPTQYGTGTVEYQGTCTIGDCVPDTSGVITPLPYTEFSKSWLDPTPAPGQDVLDINATNISAVTIDMQRAHVDCNAQLNVTSDGPITITLAGC